MSELSHVDEKGQPMMVDVSGKAPTMRTATAEAIVRVGDRVADLLRRDGTTAKGHVLETAQLAGIMAAKRTDQLVPLCHAIPIEHVSVHAALDNAVVRIEARAKTSAKTGVEMEALTAAAVAALTVYDMCKAVSKGIVIERVRLLEKTGGKSGDWRACSEINEE